MASNVVSSLTASKIKGLSLAICASGLAFGALSAPAQAVVQCTGNSNFGSSAAGSGANCGFLGVGQTFEIDVTAFFAKIGDTVFDATQFGIGVVTPGNTLVHISSLQAVVTGVVGLQTFTNAPIAIWAEDLGITNPGLGAPAPAGTADLTSFDYTAVNQAPFTVLGSNVFREVSFNFNDPGFGAFGSFKAAPDQIGLTKVDKFLIRGTLASVDNLLEPNVISFGVGPAGIPTAGETVGGFFSTEVPGPLPIAGAGAAFAWSRRLRRRQAAASSR